MSEASFEERLQRIERERGGASFEPAAATAPRERARQRAVRRPAPVETTQGPVSLLLFGFSWPFATMMICAALPVLHGAMRGSATMADQANMVLLAVASMILFSLAGIVFVLARAAIQMSARPDRVPLVCGIAGGFIVGLGSVLLTGISA